MGRGLDHPITTYMRALRKRLAEGPPFGQDRERCLLCRRFNEPTVACFRSVRGIPESGCPAASVGKGDGFCRLYSITESDLARKGLLEAKLLELEHLRLWVKPAELRRRGL